MKAFIAYLKAQRHYNQRTIKEKIRQVEKIKSLCEPHSLEKINRSDLLKLIGLLKERYCVPTVNSHLYSLEQYFYFLVETKQRADHPLKGFRIRTAKKPILRGLLTEKQLEDLYIEYPDKGHYGGRFDLYAGRNKVILGLMVYQGLLSGSLQRLRLDDPELENSRIRVPQISSARLRPRTLKLRGVQILALDRYIRLYRPELLKLHGLQTSELLFVKSGKTRFSSITGSILRKLEKTHQVRSLQELRNSRIALWMKSHNLRQVQYMAGYKTLQSLEPFNTDEIEQLKLAVEKYHPLG